MTVGQRMYEIRRDSGLNQTNFGKLVGMSQSAVGVYESGERDPPVSAVVRACQTRGIDPNWLLFGSGIKYRETQLELLERAMRLGKDFTLKYEANPTREGEIELTKLYYQYLLENGTISNEMADRLARRVAVNE